MILRLDDFVNQYVKKDLKTMIETPGLQFFSFSIMAKLVNFLERRTESKVGFLPTISKKYNLTEADKSSLITGVSFLAYDMLPGPALWLTEKADPVNGNDHMKVITQDGDSRLCLVCEDFYQDLLDTIEKVYTAMDEGDIPDYRKIKVMKV